MTPVDVAHRVAATCRPSGRRTRPSRRSPRPASCAVPDGPSKRDRVAHLEPGLVGLALADRHLAALQPAEHLARAGRPRCRSCPPARTAPGSKANSRPSELASCPSAPGQVGREQEALAGHDLRLRDPREPVAQAAWRSSAAAPGPGANPLRLHGQVAGEAAVELVRDRSSGSSSRGCSRRPPGRGRSSARSRWRRCARDRSAPRRRPAGPRPGTAVANRPREHPDQRPDHERRDHRDAEEDRDRPEHPGGGDERSSSRRRRRARRRPPRPSAIRTAPSDRAARPRPRAQPLGAEHGPDRRRPAGAARRVERAEDGGEQPGRDRGDRREAGERRARRPGSRAPASARSARAPARRPSPSPSDRAERGPAARPRAAPSR